MDKETQHIDTKFIDQSWQNMSELLDKEMPVQKRKRRFIWLWFLGLGGLLIAAMVYHYSFDFEHEIIPKSTPDKIEKIAQKETTSIDEQNDVNEKRTSYAQAKIENKELNQNALEKRVAKQNKSQKSSNIVASKVGSKSGKLAAFTPKNPSLEITQTVEEAIKVQEANIVPAAIEANYQKWSSHNISRLPLPTFSGFKKERLTEAIPIINPLNKKSLKWRFGLYTGGLTNKLGGYRVGLHSNLVLNPKWTFHIGLGYARRVQNNTTGNNDNELADAIFTNNDNAGTSEVEDTNFPSSPTMDPIAGSNGPPVNDREEDISNQLNLTKFHYFELPIVFQYQFRPRWTLDFGGQIALLHGFNYESAGENNFTTYLEAFSNASSANVQYSNGGTISDINLAAIGGISYQISPKLSAYSSYQYSNKYLTNNSINTESNKRWQQIEVGLRYYFK